MSQGNGIYLRRATILTCSDWTQGWITGVWVLQNQLRNRNSDQNQPEPVPAEDPNPWRSGRHW